MGREVTPGGVMVKALSLNPSHVMPKTMETVSTATLLGDRTARDGQRCILGGKINRVVIGKLNGEVC